MTWFDALVFLIVIFGILALGALLEARRIALVDWFVSMCVLSLVLVAL